MSNQKGVLQKEKVVQAVVVADNFGGEFTPVTNHVPLALLPLVNVPIIDYTLEFLSLGGIEETFLFCTSHADLIKKHIQKRIDQSAGWSLTMRVKIIVSECCRSFGDCLRDLDAKGLITGDFVLLGAGTVGNIKLLPILQWHNKTTKVDKGAIMTLILQEIGTRQLGSCPSEKIVLASNANQQLLFHQNLARKKTRKIELPLETLLEHSTASIHHNLRDTHVAVCSQAVLPLFTDNFDFQTREDFIRGILMNEEILGSTIYWQLIKGSQYGAAVTNWRMYQSISHDIVHRWLYPLVPDMGISSQHCSYMHLRNNIYRNKDVELARSSVLEEDVVIGSKSSVSDLSVIARSIIGENVKIGKNVVISDSYIFSNTVIEDDCVVTHSILSSRCVLKIGTKVTGGSILSEGVELIKETLVEGSLLQAEKPENSQSRDKLGKKAFRIRLSSTNDDSDSDSDYLAAKFSKMHIGSDCEESDAESASSPDSDDELSYTNSPVPDDMNLFLTEVMDSLARGFEDKLQCENLILEINSSRYAYNITVKEVNFNVSKAILSLPFQLSTGQQYLASLRPLLVYFAPILKNYIRNEAAMNDCLHAIEEIAASNNEVIECVSKILNWFYDKDFLSEEGILNWFNNLDENGRLHARVKPFTNWLQEAEEASSDD